MVVTLLFRLERLKAVCIHRERNEASLIFYKFS